MDKIFGIIIVVLLVVGVVTAAIKVYNKLVFLNFNVDKTFANIDVLLKQRADEIPNLITTVKEYIKYEEETLTKLTELRTQYLNTTTQEKKVNASNQISKEMGKIMVLSESYPELKASPSFINLQNRVSQLEDHIADRRELFNESVNVYNVGIHEFPAVLFSKLLGYVKKSLLSISNAEKKYDGVKF